MLGILFSRALTSIGKEIEGDVLSGLQSSTFTDTVNCEDSKEDFFRDTFEVFEVSC